MKGKIIALLLALVMTVSCFSAVLAENTYGPIYDEWSDMTDEQLYELAKAEKGELTVYATSSKMLKAEKGFEELYPEDVKMNADIISGYYGIY